MPTSPTPADRPADQLRAAADLLRELSTAASTDQAGRPTSRWAVRYQPGVLPGAPPQTERSCYLDAVDEATPDGRGARSLIHGAGGARGRAPSVEPQHGRFIAAMDPGVGLALAVWLERAADASDHHGHGEGGVVATLVHPALAVARQFLGTTECPECGDTGACNGGPCPLTASEPGCAMPGFVGCGCDHVTGCQHPTEPAELTADEARDLADDLNTELYQARDALAFVGECCDIADRKRRQVTTGDVREWLKGARCGRQLLAAPPAPADRAATSSPTVLAELVGTIRDLQALQQPLVDALRHIREDMHRARRCGDEWAMEWMSDVWAELPLPVRAAGGDEDAAHELAAAGVQPPTTSETEPARRRLTPREHDRAWHAIEGSAGEDGADPGTVLNAVLHALRIDAPTPAEEQAASPSRRATPPAAPAVPEETQ